MHKKLPSENVAKRVCHYSTCRNVKFNSDGINKPFVPRGDDAIINGAKIVNRRSNFIASVEKHPRSYAEMIADYSESLYKKSAVAARNDGLNNATRRSPFGTFSASPPAKKTANVAEYSELTAERNDFSPSVKSSDRYGNAVEYYAFQRRGAAEVINKSIDHSCCVVANDLGSDDRSYAKLIADCSESVNNITSALNDGPVPTRNVRSSLESITTSGKDSTHTKLREITPAVSTMPLGENMKEWAINLKENDWLREMENVMKDLRSATERKVAGIAPETKESDIPQDAAGDSPVGINGFTELRSSEQRESDTAIKRLGCRSNKIDRMESKKDFELQRQNYSHSSDKTSDPPRHFGSAAASPAARESSTHVSASGLGASKQPQVKLRMVPSERESVVSIDVDRAPVGLLDPPNSTPKHLSVVVQSDRKEDPRVADDQWNAPALRRTAKSASQRPMRISISEDSAPVKQIEFSINGKPVSELKSITARAERLDVVSSVDKIEIRIPFAGDDTGGKPEDRAREGDLSKGTNSNVGQILNVQISANFQDESATGSSAERPTRNQYGEDRIPKSPLISKIPYSPNNFPKTREGALHSGNVQGYESSKRADVKFNDEKNTGKHKISDDFQVQREAKRNSSTGETGISLTGEMNNVEVGRLSMRKANTSGFPEANKRNKDESPDDRVPSKIIPWWSSSDSFNKIRKKNDDRKPLVPPSNDRKTLSNPNKNFIAESLLSKPRDQIPKKLTKKTQSMNNSPVTTSDSSNTISYSNSRGPYEGSKSIPHYAFRLKPNQGNRDIVPEIVSNGLKGDQALTANKDINKISGVKQTKSHTLFESNTMNIKSKHDISTKEKTFVLGEKIKTPNSAQNLSPKKNEEKKNNYSVKQTRSIDDVSKNIKSKIKNILDAIKPIEKSKDGILVGYGLKREVLSRKPTVISSGVKEVQSPSPIITTKGLISESFTAETVSNKINKNTLAKQTETIEKLKTNIDILLNEKDLKNDTTVNIKALNKSDIENMKKVYKNDFMSANSSDLSNFPELQTLKKQEQLNNRIGFQDKSKQNLKSLLEADESGSNPFLNTKISSGTVQRLKKLGVSGKISLEGPKQNKLKNLTGVKNISETIQEIEKLKGTTKLANPLKESSDTMMINKLPLQIVKQIQSKNMNKIANINKLSSSQAISNSTSKIKDHSAVTKNLIDKNINETSITQSVKTAKTDITPIVTQNPKNKDALSKGYEKNFNKSGSGNILGSAGPSRKPSDSVGFKSAGSTINSRAMSNNNCAYDRKLRMESFYSNFNRKNDIMPNSQSAIFQAQENLSDVNMLKRPEPTAVGCDGSWINMDRPEKGLLYSAWLQRSDNDVKKNGKLF